MMRRTALLFACLALAGPALKGQQSGMPIAVPAPPEASCARTMVACNTTLTGSIEETDCKVASKSYADVYGVEAAGRLFVTVLMDSSELDSYLILRDERALEPLPALDNRPAPLVVHDDNGGGGTNSRIEAAAERGLFVITAQGKKRGSHGKYALTVKCEALNCQESAVAVCLAGMRFQTQVEYKEESGNVVAAAAVRSGGQKAEFYISGKGRVGEVSVSDHCSENGHFWVSANFAADPPVRVTVTDTKKRAVKVYENGPGEALRPINDRGAFPCT